MKELSMLGIDLAKNVFQLHGTDKKGHEVLKKKLNRSKLAEFVANLPCCMIGMEACGGAHHWARKFTGFGQEVRLISPQFVKPYVKSNKNDQTDAEAIVEAMSRPNMRFVPIKGVWHQDVQGLHRVRERLMKNRTALSNEIRGLLQEYGIVVVQGIGRLKKELAWIIEDRTNELSPMGRELFEKLVEELKEVEKRIAYYDQKIEEIYRSNEVCQRISKIEGVGPITATAMVAAISDAKAFKNGRQVSAWLGLVPRQNSSGGKTVLLGISKRGDRYLRSLLVHGARAVLKTVSNKKDRRSRWLIEKKKTRGYNRACVALANKNARIIWALMSSGEQYKRTVA